MLGFLAVLSRISSTCASFPQVIRFLELHLSGRGHLRMIFTDFTFVYFFLIVCVLYWTLTVKTAQNVLLLVASYIFYGWATPWFCLLIGFSTLLNFYCGKAIYDEPSRKNVWLGFSLIGSLGLLAIFKYFNFFLDNVFWLLDQFRLAPDIEILKIVLPAGISFFTFQSLSYTIDIYRGDLRPCKRLIDFAVFVSFFPQLVAGPIERAKRFLPQVTSVRTWKTEYIETAAILIIQGYFKKLVIADNLSFYVDKVYMLESPGAFLFALGTLAFSMQIYADFSGYTDIARGTAKLLGFDLSLNFRAPYAAVNPSDFWQRWHISLSTWIRDYIYIPLGGSRNKTFISYCGTVITTMFLCGLWHGAAWTYVLWGIYHGLLLICYKSLGLAGRWRPSHLATWAVSWMIMFSLVVFGWSLFRAPSILWWLNTLGNLTGLPDKAEIAAGLFILLKMAVLTAPLLIVTALNSISGWRKAGISLVQAGMLIMLVIFHNEAGQDFIYFQF